MQWLSQIHPVEGATLLTLLLGGLVAMAIYLRGRAGQGRERPAAPSPSGQAPAPNPAAPVHDPFVFGSRQEKRKAVRRGGNPVTVLIADLEGGAPVEGVAVDRSVGGLRLLIEVPVEAGTFLNVRPAQASAIVPYVQVEVRNCRKDTHGWALGCQFVRTPPSSVLWLFG